jgi:hypothetical protein
VTVEGAATEPDEEEVSGEEERGRESDIVEAVDLNETTIKTEFSAPKQPQSESIVCFQQISQRDRENSYMRRHRSPRIGGAIIFPFVFSTYWFVLNRSLRRLHY